MLTEKAGNDTFDMKNLSNWLSCMGLAIVEKIITKSRLIVQFSVALGDRNSASALCGVIASKAVLQVPEVFPDESTR